MMVFNWYRFRELVVKGATSHPLPLLSESTVVDRDIFHVLVLVDHSAFLGIACCSHALWS